MLVEYIPLQVDNSDAASTSPAPSNTQEEANHRVHRASTVDEAAESGEDDYFDTRSTPAISLRQRAMSIFAMARQTMTVPRGPSQHFESEYFRRSSISAVVNSGGQHSRVGRDSTADGLTLSRGSHGSGSQQRVVGGEPTTQTCAFHTTVLFAILANTGIMAFEAAYVERKEARIFFERAEMAFTAFFALELVYRVMEKGGSTFEFFCGMTRDSAWNLFDLVVTGVGVGSILLNIIYGVGVSAGTAVRIFRVLRIMRIFQAMKFLSIVDHVIVRAAKEMMNFALIMLLALFVFGIMSTHLLWDCPDETAAEMFKDLGSSMWSLFKLMTMDGWTAVAESVLKEKPSMLLFFLVFIFLSVSSVSIVPAIFLETHIASREHDRRMRQEIELYRRRQKEEVMLRCLHRAADAEGQGMAPVGAIQQLLAAGDTAEWILELSPIGRNDLRDIELGLFDTWGVRPRRLGYPEASCEEKRMLSALVLTETEFVEGVFKARNSAPQPHVWRSVTALRAELQDIMDEQRLHMQDLEQTTAREFQSIRSSLHLAPTWTPERRRMESQLSSRSDCQRLDSAAAMTDAIPDGRQAKREAAERALITALRDLEELRGVSPVDSFTQSSPDPSSVPLPPRLSHKEASASKAKRTVSPNMVESRLNRIRGGGCLGLPRGLSR